MKTSLKSAHPQLRLVSLALAGSAFMLLMPAPAQAQYEGVVVGTLGNSTTLYGPPVVRQRTITEESVATRNTPYGETTTHSFRTYDATPRTTIPGAVQTYVYPQNVAPYAIEPAAGPPRLIETDDIMNVQQILRNRGYYQGAIDGSLSPETSNALRFYQAHNNLMATGGLNDETLYSLGMIDRLTMPVGDMYVP